MQSRRLVGILLLLLALTAAAFLIAEVALFGTPNLATVLVASVLVGTAAAWPIASRGHATSPAPGCRECGYLSWASTDMGFCIHCGSTKVWHAPTMQH